MSLTSLSPFCIDLVRWRLSRQVALMHSPCCRKHESRLLLLSLAPTALLSQASQVSSLLGCLYVSCATARTPYWFSYVKCLYSHLQQLSSNPEARPHATMGSRPVKSWSRRLVLEPTVLGLMAKRDHGLSVTRIGLILAMKLDLYNVEVCANVGAAQRASKPPEGFLAGSHSSTRCPYRRLCAAGLGNRRRTWVSDLLGHLDTEVSDLLGHLGASLFGAYLVTYIALLRPANPSMGLGSANSTSSSSFHTALGDIESIAHTVLDQPHELSVFHRLR